MFGIKFLKSKDYDELKETLTNAQRTLEDIGWINLSTESDQNTLFSLGFDKMLKKVKLYYYNNPLAGLWVHLTTNFIFGEGISIPKVKDGDTAIQEIIDTFWKDPDNKKALTSFQAMTLLSNKIQYEGNLFFVMFEDDEANIKVRVLNTEEISDIINDEDDRMRTNFYKAKVLDRKFNFVSDQWEIRMQKIKYYPDKDNWKFEAFDVPDDKLVKDAKIFHVKINCDINDKFGVPELYRGIDWMQAHKNMMEDLATLVKALSKFAWKKKIKGTAAQVASIQGNMQSKLDLSQLKHSAGQTQIENEGLNLESMDIKGGGVKIGVDAGRQMKLMVCAGAGIFEHYFGDPSTGNLATTKSMELPMIRKFVAFQKLWEDIFNTILQYQIDMKVSIGALPGTTIEDPKTNRIKYETTANREIDIDFPPIIEEDLDIMAKALTKAKEGGLIGKELAAQLFMLAANVDNIEDEIKKLLVELEEKKKEDEDKFERELTMKQFDPTGRLDPKLPPGKKPTSGKPAPGKKDPIKEAIEAPLKVGTTRLDRKNNFLNQKLNAYRKSLAGTFRQLQKDIRDAIKVSSDDLGTTAGIVEDLDLIMETFGNRMKASARIFFPVAVQIGEKFMQAELKQIFPQLKIEETLYEANGKATNVLDERLNWNDAFIESSLVADISKSVGDAMVKPYDSEDLFRESVSKSVNKFESRIEHYVGAFWTVEEDAVVAAGSGTGVMVNFVGAEDEENCEGCSEALAGNPWLIDSVPLPGEQNCLGRCRHAVQVINPNE